MRAFATATLVLTTNHHHTHAGNTAQHIAMRCAAATYAARHEVAGAVLQGDARGATTHAIMAASRAHAHAAIASAV